MGVLRFGDVEFVIVLFWEWASSRYRSTSPVKRTGEYLIAGKDGFGSTAGCAG